MPAAGATILLAFALFILARRMIHPRWVGMRVGFRDLVTWSFLMSSAHGAGLMLVPVLLHLPGAAVHHAMPAPDVATNGILALTVHTAAMFLVMTTLALVVYRTVGVDLLQRVWVNLDLVWAGALIVAALVTVLLP
jgi:hypothetical protein